MAKKIILILILLFLLIAGVIFFVYSLRTKVTNTTPLSAVPAVEPGIEKIKADLIGHSVPGWTFDKITEFRKATITSIARTRESIEFRTDLVMYPYNSSSETTYDLQIIVTYRIEDTGWSFSQVEELLISFDMEIPPGRSVQIKSIPGCKLLPDSTNRLYWTNPNWDYEIISGPDYAGIVLPAADSYELRSKAKKPVKARISFRPDTAPD